MTLYGLDIILEEDGFKLVEVNGIKSGMNGFREVYGDNHVEENVYSMLEEKYGKVTLNDGGYIEQEEPEELEYVNKFSEQLDKVFRATPELIRDSFPYEPYRGQESTVFDVINQRMDEDKVNDYITTEVVRNDFLLSMVLKGTEIEEHYPDTAPIAQEAYKSGHMREVARKEDRIIAKPAAGFTGIGVDVFSPLFFSRLVENYARLRPKGESYYSDSRKNLSLEWMVENEKFEYERALGVLQPMVGDEGDRYSCVRAVVCNGEYIDAYERVSNSEVVNYSNGAWAEEFNEPEGFEEFCENVIDVLEEETGELREDFREELYREYLEKL